MGNIHLLTVLSVFHLCECVTNTWSQDILSKLPNLLHFNLHTKNDSVQHPINETASTIWYVDSDIESVSQVQHTFPAPKGRLLTPENGCGISKVTNTKIVGGTVAKPGAFPWMALLVYINEKNETSFKCGGTLITSRHVMTAAHCLLPTLAFVRLGEHDLTTTRDGLHIEIAVDQAVPHPDADKINDIAILTLQTDVEFSDRIWPICLPLTEEIQSKSFVDTNPFVAGWGRLRENGTRAHTLMQVQLPVIDNAKCQIRYHLYGKATTKEDFGDLVICAGNLAGGEDTCQGDSGGPLMLPILVNGTFPMYQIGIVSWGAGCARSNLPGIYTRVSSFIDWIKGQVNVAV